MVLMELWVSSGGLRGCEADEGPWRVAQSCSGAVGRTWEGVLLGIGAVGRTWGALLGIGAVGRTWRALLGSVCRTDHKW